MRIWQRILQALVESGWIEATASIDATYVKAHRSAHGGNGGKTQAIGLSRGGQTTKIHVLTDALCRPAIIRLTPGNVSDIRIAADLLAIFAGLLSGKVPIRSFLVNVGRLPHT